MNEEPVEPSSDSQQIKVGVGARDARWTARVARFLSIDDAIRFAVLARIWQLITGPITQLMIVYHFTRAGQDYFQAFSRMLGMQVFVELGLSVVLINVASHEWVGLSLVDGRIRGDASALSRLVSLGRMMVRWYAIAAMLFVTAIMLVGFVFFQDTESLREVADQSREHVSWANVWICLVLLTGGQLALLPLTAILEGCHQLGVLNRVRWWQAVAGTLTVWLMVVLDYGLWALVGAAAVRLVGETYLTFFRFRPFLDMLRQQPEGPRVEWRSEILPLQWRIAVQGIFLWMASQMPLLVVFRYHDEGDAARLGMTWTVLTALQSASLAWIETRRPMFGTMIARQDYAALDQLFFRMTRLAVGLMIVGSTVFCLTVWWMESRSEWLIVRLTDRLLPVFPTVLFSVAMVLYQFALCTNLYVRAHKRDPFLAASIISNATIAGLQLWWGRTYGTTGVAFGYLTGIALVQVPLWSLIWATTRREWHRPGVVDE